ncbi:MAG: sel1 repeat family protein, partial [Oceanospirillaceae bacterium]|nr:sel1 repeat family protein [Oceanospirillaceae bacterium]
LTFEEGIPESLHFIGKIYADQNSDLYDFDKAVYYYEMSVKNRNWHSSDSLFELGLIYDLRNTEYYNSELAIEYYKLASELEHPRASFNLGVKYQVLGDPVSLGYAVKYYNRSIESNRLDIKDFVVPRAYNNLGVIYLQPGKLFNPRSSIELFEKAVSLGADNANYYLGYIFAEGLGVEVDRSLARNYFQVLASNGDVASIDAIKKYELHP